MVQANDYPDFEKLKAYIEGLPMVALAAAEPAMEKALIFLHGRLPEYPPEPSPVRPDGLSFMSDKQRAWFFAAVKKGQLKGWRWTDGHPEKFASARTANLGRKFTEETTRDDKGVIGQLGTNVPYAPWVVGPTFPGEQINGKTMYQARIHADRWWQFSDVIEENMDKAWQEFTDTFWKTFFTMLEEK